MSYHNILKSTSLSYNAILVVIYGMLFFLDTHTTLLLQFLWYIFVFYFFLVVPGWLCISLLKLHSLEITLWEKAVLSTALSLALHMFLLFNTALIGFKINLTTITVLNVLLIVSFVAIIKIQRTRK